MVLFVVAQAGIAVGKNDLLVCRRIVFFLGDLLLIQHGLKHRQLALAVIFAAPIAAQRIVHGGVVRNGDQAGTFGKRQFGYIFAKIFLRCRLYAIAGVAQIDIVQIRLQDHILVVFFLQLQGAVDFCDLTLHGHLIVVCQILDELLRDGRPALGTVRSQCAENRAQRAVPVHALVGHETLILNGDGGILQSLGYLVQRGGDTVFAVQKQRLIHDPLAAVRILIVQLRGAFRVILAHVHFDLAAHRLVDVCHKYADKHSNGQNEHQCDRTHDLPGPLMIRSFFCACLCLLFVTLSVK